MDDDLLPTGAPGVADTAFLIHFVEGGLAKVEGSGFPAFVRVGVGDMEKADDEVADVMVRVGDDGAVVLGVDGDHRRGEALGDPGADGAADDVAGFVFELRVAAEVERYFAGIESAAAPAHGAIGAGGISYGGDAGVACIADEDGDVRGIGAGGIKRGRKEHILVSEQV
jgi:hypothetical protein